MSTAAPLIVERIERIQDAEGGFYFFFPAAAEKYPGGRLHKFAQNLPAGPAGAYGGPGIRGGNCQRLKAALSAAYCLEYRVPFRADRKPEGTVFHVTAGKNSPVIGEQGRAHPEFGIRRVRKIRSFPGFRE